MREALETDDKALARRIIQQFMAKIMTKEGTGTLYYTFPFLDDLFMPAYGNLGLMKIEQFLKIDFRLRLNASGARGGGIRTSPRKKKVP